MLGGNALLDPAPGGFARTFSPREGASSVISDGSIDTATTLAAGAPSGGHLALQPSQYLPTRTTKDVVDIQTRKRDHREEFDFDEVGHTSGLLITEAPNTGQSSFAASTVSDIAKQHYEWAQELESVDQKQADLVVLQWKLVRNQTGMLAQQLVEVRKQIEDLQRGQDATALRVDHLSADTDNFETRLKGFVRQLFEKLEHSVARARHDVEVEAKRREAGDMEIHAKLQQMCEEVGRTTRLNPLEQEVRKLRADLNLHAAQVPTLREHLQQSTDELKASVDSVHEHHRRVKESLDKEIRDRHLAHDDLHSAVRLALDKERGEREAHSSKIHGHFGNLQSEIAEHKEELPVLKLRLEEMEEKMHTGNKEHLKKIEASFVEPTTRLKDMERRIDHMQASISQESVARQSLSEVFEQMLKTEKTKLMNLITQKAAFARLDCEELQKSVAEKLDKERAEREESVEGLQSMHARHKNSVNDRVSAVEGECRSVVERYQGLTTEVRDGEARQRKLEDQLLAAIRDATREHQAALAEEKAARELMDAQLEEQLTWHTDHHDKVREIFLQRAPRSMRLAMSCSAGRPSAGGDCSSVESPSDPRW